MSAELDALKRRVRNLEDLLVELLDDNKHILVGGYEVQRQRIVEIQEARGEP